MDEGSKPGPPERIAESPPRGRASVFVADERAQGAPLPVTTLERLRLLASYVLDERRVPEAMEVSVLCVDRDDIARLNAQHMGKEGPTDVLAFPIDQPGETIHGEPAILGDVVLCPDVAAEQATTEGKSPLEELELLLVHGILHLLGHDHAEDAERDEMFGMTDLLLTRFRKVAA